jgi:hypothetical protein
MRIGPIGRAAGAAFMHPGVAAGFVTRVAA